MARATGLFCLPFPSPAFLPLSYKDARIKRSIHGRPSTEDYVPITLKASPHMNLSQLFNREGRLSRRGFVPYYLAYIVGVFFTLFVVSKVCYAFPELFLEQVGDEINLNFNAQAVFFLVSLPFYMALFFSGMRRCRDIDVLPFFAVFLAIPWVNLIFGLYLCVRPGDKGENQYGRPPVA